MRNLRDFAWQTIYSYVKNYSRSNLYEFAFSQLDRCKAESEILIVGAHGPVLEQISKRYSSFRITTLDINPNHDPHINLDFSTNELNKLVQARFDAVILLEVMEHIHFYERAIKNGFDLLKCGGVLIASTPWIIPIHDSPHDYLRFTRFEINYVLKNAGFDKIEIYQRGNYFQSVALLCLRSIMEKFKGKRFLVVLGFLLSLASGRPKISVATHSSVIGYCIFGEKRK